MRIRLLQPSILAVCFLLLCVSPSYAQWVTQTVELNPGWNAVYLEVEPFPRQCDLLLDGVPVRSVWTHDQRFSPVQFIDDPAELRPDSPDWRVYFPPGSPHSFLTSLFILQAGKGYLVNATESFSWNVKGRPLAVRQRWNPGSFHLAGFSVDPGNPPTFAAWFAASPAHQPLEIRTLSGGSWVRVANPSSTLIRPGRAYWVKCHENSGFQGPVDVRLPEGRELDLDRLLVEQTLEIARPGTARKTVTVDLVPSETVPPVPAQLRATTDLPARAGGVVLDHYAYVTDPTPTFEYRPLPAAVVLPAADPAAQSLRLAVRRPDMGPAAENALYQSILLIRDGAGYRKMIGVVSEGHDSVSASARAASKAAGIARDPAPEAGLWIGTANLSRVSEPDLPDVLTETPAEFVFTLILHVDAAGDVRMLNEVTQFWREGTYAPDPENPDYRVVDQPGRYVLVTRTAPQALLDEIGTTVVAASLRDSRPFARRISTAMFFLNDSEGNPEEPLVSRSGAFGAGGSTLQATLVVDDTDPLNPFHHRYHPVHGYPDGSAVPDQANDWTVMRVITMQFTGDPPDGFVLPGWGDTECGGVYRETMTNLARDPVTVEGVFRLTRVSDVPVLNDGL